MTKINSPRGTQDILPANQPLWQLVTGICREVAEQFSFQPITLPTFEEIGLFSRAIGSGTDIMDKELFLIHNRHGDSEQYALRPEGTAGMVRAYIQQGMQTWPQPVKLYSILNLFRYERPQRGRFREHTQFDIEYFGDLTPFADAWIILTHWQVLKRLGVSTVSLALNSLGTSEERATFRTILIDYLTPFKEELSEDSRRRLTENPLRILDSKDSADQRIASGAPILLDSLGQASKSHFQAVCSYLAAWEIPFNIDHRLVRGLDYYSLTCFEWVHQHPDGSRLSVGGGGRYDNLVPLLDGPQVGAVGAGLGIDRIVSLLETVSAKSPDVYVILVDKAALTFATSVIKTLATTKYQIDADFSKPSLSSQLKAAAKRGARYALIVGSEEAAEGKVIVRKLNSGEQLSLSSQDLASYRFE